MLQEATVGASSYTETSVADNRLTLYPGGKIGINRTLDNLNSNTRTFQVQGSIYATDVVELASTTDSTNLNTGSFYTFGGASIAKTLLWNWFILLSQSF